jgi:RNA-binding protein
LALTGKQKRVLRGMGMLLDPVVYIGKEGVEVSIAATEDALRRKELIKVRVQNTAPEGVDDTACTLAAATRSEVAGSVGHTFLLYRRNPDVKFPIELPPGKGGD